MSFSGCDVCELRRIERTIGNGALTGAGDSELRSDKTGSTSFGLLSRLELLLACSLDVRLRSVDKFSAFCKLSSPADLPTISSEYCERIS